MSEHGQETATPPPDGVARGQAPDAGIRGQARQYFDGDEAPYRPNHAVAARGEYTILKWLGYLEWIVIVCVVLVVGLVLVVVWQSTRPSVETKFVVQNEVGQFHILNWDQFDPAKGQIKEALERWLVCARAIPTDGEVLNACWRMVPMFIKKDSQCAAEMRTYQTQRRPGEQLHKKSVLVRDLAGGQEPDGRWRFSWEEQTYQLDHGRQGPLVSHARWQALLIARREHPKDPKQIELQGRTINPLGLLCTTLSWWAVEDLKAKPVAGR